MKARIGTEASDVAAMLTFVDSIDEHLEIMDAIEAGDNQKAHDLMKAHLVMARDVEATV